ncbi:MAG TPA: hypothetical protein DD827_05890 [Gammaproteobacteria bacterium]|nr:hypothetical protein [Gammaproteobacteria bacterium]
MQKIVKYTQYSPHFHIKNVLFLISLSSTSIFRDAINYCNLSTDYPCVQIDKCTGFYAPV